MSLTAALGFVAVAVSLVSVVPQVVRTLRTRQVSGLSAGTLLITLATFTLWGAYGIGIGDWAQIVNNVVCGTLFVVLAVAVARYGDGGLRRWHIPAVCAATAAAAVSLCVTASPAAAAVVGSVVGLFTKVPQVRVAVSGQDLSGLDPWFVILGLVTPLLWVGYGVAALDMVVVASSLVGATLQAVIVHRRLPARRTLGSLADGRLGALVAQVSSPLAARFPVAG